MCMFTARYRVSEEKALQYTSPRMVPWWECSAALWPTSSPTNTLCGKLWQTRQGLRYASIATWFNSLSQRWLVQFHWSITSLTLKSMLTQSQKNWLRCGSYITQCLLAWRKQGKPSAMWTIPQSLLLYALPILPLATVDNDGAWTCSVTPQKSGVVSEGTIPWWTICNTHIIIATVSSCDCCGCALKCMCICMTLCTCMCVLCTYMYIHLWFRYRSTSGHNCYFSLCYCCTLQSMPT